MNKSEKRTKLVEKIENHVRLTARNLVKFDTIQETLDFTVESFLFVGLCGDRIEG
ncbi:hypothetical protein [Peribacillus simplex]|uniref:Uncharacterized protein n=1 Tax=Peribacillus simplex TaxID=1478 RepID=A0A9W4L0I8_9BACI|nr:hypothetical protein [Peribacillus simplex]MDR4926999.1 hypothetical protein [Peribacillus simplex]WHX92294.1 hypothetical protein QNH50_05350 [Peribacillus simplex]CAH0230692.1 hypothetical protein SRABI133_02630 [Peribacillus simplex]